MSEINLSLLIYGLVIGLGAGCAGGILAGLAGVGGGLIYVPVFYAFMPSTAHGISFQILASLLAIVLTGYFSSRSHYRLGHIHKASCRQLLPGLIIGATLGLWSTLQVSEVLVLFFLGSLDLWIAVDYGRSIKIAEHHHERWLAIFSGPIGFASGLLGVGGGTMLVPLLRRSLSLRQAVGTSALCGVVMAFSAVGLNMLFESAWQSAMHQQWLFLAGALSGILLILPRATSWAAELHQQVPEHILRIVLKILFLSLASGLFIAALTNVYTQ